MSADERQRVDRIGTRRKLQRVAFTIEPAKNGVGELARADAVSSLGKLDGLCDRCVRGNAAHEKELRGAESKQVEKIGVEPDHPAAHTLVEISIEARAASQHAVHQLARPAAIARVELCGAAIEGRIQKFTGPQVAANLGGGNARVCDAALSSASARPGATGMMYRDSTGRSIVVIRPRPSHMP
jgi:hypothetical protein